MIGVLLVLVVAGKLADGWKGQAYGPNPAVVGTTPPAEGCTLVTDVNKGWACTQEIGGQSYQVSYLVESGLFTGVGIRCEGYEACRNLRDVLDAGWGKCVPEYGESVSLSAKCTWSDGSVRGIWDYNQYSYKGSAIAFHMSYYEQAKAETKERAAKAAASDL